MTPLSKIQESLALLETFYNGQETVDSAGTAQTIAASQELQKGVLVKALAGNTGIVYVGDADVSASNGFELSAKEELFVPVDNLASVYIDAATNDDGVSFIGG